MNYNGMSLQELLRFADSSEDPLMRAIIEAVKNENYELQRELSDIEYKLSDAYSENDRLEMDYLKLGKQNHKLREELKAWRSQPKTLCAW